MNLVTPTPYPDRASMRDQWIIERRPERNALDPRRPYGFFVEQERTASAELVPIATILLTNRECPWHCLMCDLWRNTLSDSVPAGAIPEQIGYALSHLDPARHIKLYNSGSFFDPHAIPPEDYQPIADRVSAFERVIVESHPSLVGDRILRFRDLLSGQLEVAMGLETVHPQALAHLNKRMTLDQFAAAAERLRANRIDLRVFILVQPPFTPREDALHWVTRSLDFAFDCGATAATLIATRAGNGATDVLLQSGDFVPPDLRTVEQVFDYGIQRTEERVFQDPVLPGRVFVDLWDIERVAACPACRAQRIARIAAMNLSQSLVTQVACDLCGNDID
jgi:archaeosine synthase beta-subunit